MVAMEVLLLLQLPDVAVFVKLIVAPSHTVEGPPITPGSGLTVTVVQTPQPVENK